MKKRSWIHQLFTRPATRRIRKTPHRARLAFEVLEHRRVLSALCGCPGITCGAHLSPALAAGTAAPQECGVGLGKVLTVTSSADIATQAGTLRYAVAHAQSGDTIQLTAAIHAPIVLTLGELVLSKNVTIESVAPSTPTISGDGLSRIFEVAPALKSPYPT